MPTHEQKPTWRETFLRAFAVLGLIAVLLLGAWGIIQLAVAIPTIFSNIGSGASGLFSGIKKETLSVSAIAALTSGQTLQISWEHKNKEGEYSYAISYACKTGLSVKAPLPTGSYQSVACDTPFNYTNASDKTTLIPSVTGSVPVPLTVTVVATKLSNGVITAQGSATTNVAPAAATASKDTAKGSTSSKGATASTSYVPATSVKMRYGYGDLAITINSVAPAGNGLTNVTFTISNIGTNVVSSGWSFVANLPINGSYQYMSQPQRALNPGDKVVYTLTFSDARNYNYPYHYGYGYGYTAPGYYYGAGSYTCNGYVPCYNNSISRDPIDYPNNYWNNSYSYGPGSITVDPQNYIWESNEYNNTVSF
jgi:hypothetical protein